jgi:RHS repeat-associated protein
MLTQNTVPSTINTYTYTHDNVGNRTGMTDTAGTHNYTYDEIYRLVQATHPALPTEQYSYDPVGNRIGTTVDAGNRLLEDATYTYQYDDSGNLTQKTHKTSGEITIHSYDTENRLIQVTKPGMTASYKYDPFGRRIEKNVNGIITRYLYDGEDIIIEYNGSGQIVANYTHGSGIDEPLSMEKNGQEYYYHQDGLGSVTGITDSNGTLVQGYEYDSYGKITSVLDSNMKQPYTYTGREYDEETGLYYYRARYYDSDAGRFISEDPIGLAGGDVNYFAYVGNNAVNWIDPSGLFVIGVEIWARPPVTLRPVPRTPFDPNWAENPGTRFDPWAPKPGPTHKPWWPWNWKPEPPHLPHPHPDDGHHACLEA